jgi:ABC-type nitrate/sulfonate/bicarbonate transport system permease component
LSFGVEQFLRRRNLEFVKAARAMGLSNWQIIRKHLLPNAMTPVITFLPFRMSGAILLLTSLDFLGLGVPGLPSLGELLREGKENLDAWWISASTFIVLVLTLLPLTYRLRLHRRRRQLRDGTGKYRVHPGASVMNRFQVGFRGSPPGGFMCVLRDAQRAIMLK